MASDSVLGRETGELVPHYRGAHWSLALGAGSTVTQEMSEKASEAGRRGEGIPGEGAPCRVISILNKTGRW